MSGVRPNKRGSFGGQLEDLIRHFPDDKPARTPPKIVDRKALQEKRDIHAHLFAMAWGLEPDEADWLNFTGKL